MRVLHVYSGNLYGGIETMLVTLARHRNLCPEMEPHFALCFEGRLIEELSTAGVPIHMLGNVRVSRPLTVRRARGAFGKLLESVDFDTVVCHAPWSQAIFGPIVRKTGLPLVFWMHGTADGRHWSEHWARRTPPDLVLCNSHFTASTLSNLYRSVTAEVIYYPVVSRHAHYSEDERRAVREELETPTNATIIIQVSRMEAWKGHALHLAALAKLKDDSNWICWFVGGAQRPQEVEYLTELKRTASDLGILERIRFVGERSDIPLLLGAADIHCQPNIGPEPFGITFIEALFAGLPIVTTSVGGALEIVNKACGVLVTPNSASALSSALRSLLDEPTRRLAMGRSGPARALELCDPEKQMKRLNQLVASVAHRGLAA